MKRLFARSADTAIAVSSIVEPEVIGAIVDKVPVSAQRAAIQEFYLDYVYVVDGKVKRRMFFVLEVSEHVARSAASLLGRHPEANIGHADAVHLATAGLVQSGLGAGELMVFVTADSGMQELAEAVGFSVFNPDRHDISDFRTLFPS